MRLPEFIVEHKELIVDRARTLVTSRMAPYRIRPDLINGIPKFVDQLVIALNRAVITRAVDHVEINLSATLHGDELFKMGVPIDQVVHEYGDICQVITMLIQEKGENITAEEFQTLNLCLDDAIVSAITQHAVLRDRDSAEKETKGLGVLAHELRNSIGTAMLSHEMIRQGRVAIDGRTSLMLTRSLANLKNLVDRSLVNVRLEAATRVVEVIPVFDLLDDIEMEASIQARAHDTKFTLIPPSQAVNIQGDRQIIHAALCNLLQNAFKFTRKPGNVTLNVEVASERVLFIIQDECGGIPGGDVNRIFLPYAQASSDRSGLGLGLSICLEAAKTNNGDIRVRDLPGKGCVFTLDLPVYVAPG